MSSKFITNRGCIRIKQKHRYCADNSENLDIPIYCKYSIHYITYVWIRTNCYAEFNKIESSYNNNKKY
jgi:hypothetical protein